MRGKGNNSMRMGRNGNNTSHVRTPLVSIGDLSRSVWLSPFFTLKFQGQGLVKHKSSEEFL